MNKEDAGEGFNLGGQGGRENPSERIYSESEADRLVSERSRVFIQADLNRSHFELAVSDFCEGLFRSEKSPTDEDIERLFNIGLSDGWILPAVENGPDGALPITGGYRVVALGRAIKEGVEMETAGRSRQDTKDWPTVEIPIKVETAHRLPYGERDETSSRTQTVILSQKITIAAPPKEFIKQLIKEELEAAIIKLRPILEKRVDKEKKEENLDQLRAFEGSRSGLPFYVFLHAEDVDFLKKAAKFDFWACNNIAYSVFAALYRAEQKEKVASGRQEAEYSPPSQSGSWGWDQLADHETAAATLVAAVKKELI
jgi:hypothetical protein